MSDIYRGNQYLNTFRGEVVNYQLDNLKRAKNYYLNSENQQIKDKIAELEGILGQVQKREQWFFGLFEKGGNFPKITNVNELNNTVKEKIEPLLVFNNNTIMSKLKLVDQKTDMVQILARLQPLLEERYTKIVKKKTQEAFKDPKMAKAVKNSVIAYINKGLASNISNNSSVKFYVFEKDSSKEVSLGRVLKNFIIDENGISIAKDLETYMSQQTKKRLKISLGFNATTKEKQVTDDDFVASTVFEEVVEKNRQQYSAWGYNLETLDEKQKREIVDNLLEQCLQYIPDERCRKSFRVAFKEVPIDAWFVSTTTAVSGILGEVQLGAILHYLFGNRYKILQTGSLLNELNGRRQFSIDAFMRDCGFQVKNYNLHTDPLNIGKKIPYFTLSESGSITEISNKLKIDDSITQVLKYFFAIDSYNVTYDPSFEDVRQRIDNTKRQYGNYIGALGTNNFLKFSEKIEAKLGSKTVLKSEEYYNVFYFSNGKFFAASEILKEIIKLLEDLLHATTETISLTTSYSGKTSKNEKDEAKPQEWIRYEDVAEKIMLRIHYRFNL